MRLYRGKIELIAEEVISALKTSGAIEVEDPAEARLDVEAVLKEYLRLDREVVEEAKNRMELRGMTYSQLGRVKNQVAKDRGAPPQEEILPYLLDQILNILFHSTHVGEIFADDAEMRKTLTPVLKKHMEVDTELDREVRSKIKNLEEGTSEFEIEYARVMGQIKQRKRLS
jgi:hypothetical protein